MKDCFVVDYLVEILNKISFQKEYYDAMRASGWTNFDETDCSKFLGWILKKLILFESLCWMQWWYSWSLVFISGDGDLVIADGLARASCIWSIFSFILI